MEEKAGAGRLTPYFSACWAWAMGLYAVSAVYSRFDRRRVKRDFTVISFLPLWIPRALEEIGWFHLSMYDEIPSLLK